MVLGILSRACLYARQFDKAKQYSNQLLAKNNYLMNEAEFGDGFSLVDIIRNQKSVERKAYPTDPIDYTYVDETGQTKTLQKTPQGHRIFKFPDNSDFCANSKYYLYRITDAEELANKNLYSKYPNLSIYTE